MSSNSLVDFIVNPVIVKHIPIDSNIKIRQGSQVRLECEAEGHPTPTISWRYNGGSRLPAGARLISENVLM